MQICLTHKTHKLILCCIFALVFLFQPVLSFGQSGNYWSGNFNEESALVSGAVVGGGAGPSAIYYNPAGISEIEESKLSINASLFAYDHFKASNAWGNDIDYISTRFIVVPRFVSFMLQPKKNPNLSLEFAFLNNENYQTDDLGSVDEYIDVLEYLPGEERYNAFYRYDHKFRDDWLGAGGSYKINPNLFLGASMFVSARTLQYSYTVDIEAGEPFNENTEDGIPYFTAKYKDQEYLKFNNYRLLWKFGLLYKMDQLNVGINITTPSINVYSDGKSVMRKKSQSNITNPETSEPVPNYLVSDYAEKKDVSVNHKSPVAVSLGLTWHNSSNTSTIYSTVEYFGGIDPYRMVEAEESFDLSSGSPDIEAVYDDWLTYAWGAKPVFNAAFGYRWEISRYLFMAGFRTDFSYRKNYEYFPLEERRAPKAFVFDRYHFTGGITTNILGQDLMAGIQYSLGVDKNQQQFINLSDPVEYDPNTKTALQGERLNNMNSVLNSISFYFGATFNFGGDDEK